MEDALSPDIILGNTYHLALEPGTELLAGSRMQHIIYAGHLNIGIYYTRLLLQTHRADSVLS